MGGQPLVTTTIDAVCVASAAFNAQAAEFTFRLRTMTSVVTAAPHNGREDSGMTDVGFVSLVIGTLLVGAACQFIGRARANYEWEIGTVGGLFGALLGNAFNGFGLTPAFGVDGLSVVPSLLGAIVVGGSMVFVFRQFGSPMAPARRAQLVAEAETCSRRVTVSFTKALIEEPILDRMRRQCGVQANVGRVEIRGNRGWIELQLIGAAEAVDAALSLAQRSGVQLETEVRVSPLAA
jgi:NIL domain-containing protein